MLHPANSFLDLAWLILEKPPPGWRPPKFLIFFDSIAESIVATKFLWSQLPSELHWMIKWFNTNISQEFHDDKLDNLKRGITWGLTCTCTDSFGMVTKCNHQHQSCGPRHSSNIPEQFGGVVER
jgi:hypothetical protein